jgi:hypothetical protein
MNEPNLTVKEDRGIAKTRNIDPEVVAVFKTWGRMNQANVARLGDKLQKGIIGRNGAVPTADWRLDSSWHVQNFLSLGVGSKFARHDMASLVPLNASHAYHQAAATKATSVTAPPTAATASTSHSAGSAAEQWLAGSSSSSTSRRPASQPTAAAATAAASAAATAHSSAGSAAEQPMQPKPKTRPVQKQVEFDSVWLSVDTITLVCIFY